MSRFAAVFFLSVALSACGGRDESLPDTGAGDAGTHDDLGSSDLGGGDASDATTGTDLGRDGGPDCTGLPVCTTPGRRCDGNTRVVCGLDARGCLVEARTDCTGTLGGTCDETGGAHCVADSCASLPTACPAPSRTCDMDILVTCAANPAGCLVTTREDCTTIGSTCLPGGAPDAGVPPDGGAPSAVCSAPDPCYLVDPATRCSTEGRSCETPTRLLDCHPNATGCLVGTRTDCLSGASPLAHCDDTLATPACVDPCAGLTLCAPGDPATRCEGARIVTCTTDAMGCYERTEVNCASMSMGCDPTGGTPVCSGALCPSAVGTLDCTGTPSRHTGNTATSSDVLATNSCTTTGYPGNEGIWEFSNAVGAIAHVTLTSVADGLHAYDMFVLDGTGDACDPSAPCITSTPSTGTTTLDFAVPAGGRRYVVVDGQDPTATTSYALLVDCDLCGDSVITSPEQCDDGNTTRGDGCDDSCLIEAGWACTGAPSVCHRTVCGNGIAEPGETCDDGNTVDGDGCSSSCLAETFTAVAGPGGMVTVSGSLGGTDPTFTRPYQDCSTTSSTGGVSYDTWVLGNTGTVPVTVTVTATWAGDGYLFAYRPPFDPTMPGLDCAVGDDDYMGTGQSQVTITIAPGTQVVIVATEFGPGSAAGPYSLLIHS